MSVRTSGNRQPSVWASVVSDNAPRLRDWLQSLGFTQDLLIPGDREGAIHHCQLDWPDGGRVLLSSTDERATPCLPGTSSLHVVCSDPDAVMARALKLGAAVVHPLTDQTDYPSRDFTVADPDGNPLDLRDLRRLSQQPTRERDPIGSWHGKAGRPGPRPILGATFGQGRTDRRA